jgi:phosphatidylinositol alpha-1,6-mannosyltransferase
VTTIGDMLPAQLGHAITIGAPGYAAITLRGVGDGIAYAARLTAAALTELADRAPRFVELAPVEKARVRFSERIRFAGRLWIEHLRGNADWWLFNHVGLAKAYRTIPRTVRRPYGVFLNGIEVWDPDLDDHRRAALRSAAARIAISTHTAKRVHTTHPDVGPIHACPLALLRPLETSPESADKSVLARLRDRSVAIVGRISASERYKGHDQLIEAWPGVLAEVPDAQLVIVGEGDDRQRLEEKARAYGIAAHVLFTGFVSDATLRHLLERTALFSMPSRGEGFGLVYLEAMAANRPCVGSTVDAAADIIVDGETGFLVDPADAQHLASCIARLLLDRELRMRMGAAGRRRYEAHYTYERFRDRLAAVLHETLASKARILR